jgi:hypothetical protein
MDQNAWIMLFVGIAVTCALFALGIILYPKLKNEKQGYPFEAEIEAALLPIIFQGISAAYRLSEQSVDELQLRIKGADKKKIAESIYSMLPEKIGNFDLALIKRIVPRDRFEQLVQDAFDRFDRFFIEHQQHFDQLFEQWKTGNAPAQVSAPVTPP